ncbi:hypothetical protein [Algivirga pacifica]|uniref:hypothetical protein n=1 Tax=Algivirga pacifica TaxID=1162670 RepID=UPI0031E698BD
MNNTSKLILLLLVIAAVYSINAMKKNTPSPAMEKSPQDYSLMITGTDKAVSR